MPLLAFPGGYGGMVNTDGGRVSLSCCIRRDTLRAMPERVWTARAPPRPCCITSSRPARASATPCTGHARPGAGLSAGPIRPGIRDRHADGMFRIGNCAGEAHPIVAEGISMAMQSAALLCRLLIARTG